MNAQKLCASKKFQLFLVIILLVLIIVIYVRTKKTEEDFENPRNDLEHQRLQELIRRGDLLVKYVEEKEYPTPEISARIVENWNVLREKNRIGITPSDSDTPGFVVNKNDSMQLCLTKSPDDPDDLDDINLGTFVLIHEISHLGAIEYQHGPEFLSIFIKLLQASVEIGIWKYVDYFEQPRMYCDFYVNVTPDLQEAFTNMKRDRNHDRIKDRTRMRKMYANIRKVQI